MFYVDSAGYGQAAWMYSSGKVPISKRLLRNKTSFYKNLRGNGGIEVCEGNCISQARVAAKEDSCWQFNQNGLDQN